MSGPNRCTTMSGALLADRKAGWRRAQVRTCPAAVHIDRTTEITATGAIHRGAAITATVGRAHRTYVAMLPT